MHDIVTRLRDFFDRPNPVLFAGAGVGSRVGFPTWDTYIKYLADVCDRFNDHESAVLIRRRLDQRQHLGAVSVFKTTHLIPTGERWKALAEPFTRDATNPDKLDALVGLPFSAIVTTNYDHSLHDVHSNVFHKWVTPVNRGSLRSSSQSRDYFIARIHGTAENPTSMAVDTNDYEKLGQEDDYLDFLLNLLRDPIVLILWVFVLGSGHSSCVGHPCPTAWPRVRQAAPSTHSDEPTGTGSRAPCR